MSWFTRIIITIFLCIAFGVAAVLFARGAYGAATTCLGFAFFFVAMSIIANFESHNPPEKLSLEAKQPSVMRELYRYWRNNSWQGKFAAIFCGSVMVIILAAKVFTLLK